jgi:hypothetical protein
MRGAMSTSSGANFSRIERCKHHLVPLERRQLLSFLFAAMAVPRAATPAWWNLHAGPRRVVIINGWVLLEDDVHEVTRHAA